MSYTPSTTYAYNGGGGVTITRSGVGVYDVNFSGLAGGIGGGNVQVTAYGAGNEYCKVQNWNFGGFTTTVRCFTGGGSPIDTLYTVMVTWPKTQADGLGYVWADQATSASYTPSTTYSYNGSGGAVSITRSGVGIYAVTFAGLTGGIGGGHVQVTAYGAGSEYCKVQSWNFGGFTTNVRCFTASGSSVDARYTLLVNWPQTAAEGLGYAWANLPTSSSYTPSTTYSYNASGSVLITRSGVGVYSVQFSGLSGGGGHVQVTAYGTGNQSCKVQSWNFGGFTANVRCFTGSGSLTDTLYTIMVVLRQ